MPLTGDAASRWRALAEEARSVAAEMTDPEARQSMLQIAEGYERLARYAEARAKNPQPEYFNIALSTGTGLRLTC
jgi:hypothetical protein